MLSRHSKVLAVLTLSLAIAVGGLVLTRHVIAVAGEADAERLNRSILDYIAHKNPQAPIRAFQRFPEALVAEAQKSNLDHCLVLAQAEVESEFRHDAVGLAGEIGLFQILPSTAAIMEPVVGPFKRPATKAVRDAKSGRETYHPAVVLDLLGGARGELVQRRHLDPSRHGTLALRRPAPAAGPVRGRAPGRAACPGAR